MKKIKLLPIVSIAVLTLAGCASKPKGPPPISPEIQQRAYTHFVEVWDHNNDGAATCSDVDMIRADLFLRMDADNSGTLNEGEFRAAVFEDKSYQLLLISDLDTNEDSLLSLDEFSAQQHYRFHHHDKNEDCVIDLIEGGDAYRALFEKRRADRNREDRTRRKEVPDIIDY